LDIIRSTNRAREGKANNQSEVAATEEHTHPVAVAAAAICRDAGRGGARRGEERRGEERAGGREGRERAGTAGKQCGC
jgi:hypothetical protein